MVQWLMILFVSVVLLVGSGLKILWLWRGLDSVLGPGTSICYGCGQKREKKKCLDTSGCLFLPASWVLICL